jgi:hypothetical protein
MNMLSDAEMNEWLIQRNERLRATLVRCQTVLSNMALENERAWLGIGRWPIHHEPLRADARHLLPDIERVLVGAVEQHAPQAERSHIDLDGGRHDERGQD